MKKPALLRKERRTNPVVWLAAIICIILAVSVILTGIFVFIVYMAYQPKMPYLKVAYAHLFPVNYNQSGLLSTQMIINIVAENDNLKTHSSFTNIDFILGFHHIAIANLQANPFDLPRNSSNMLNYMVYSSSIPLDGGGMAEMDMALKNDRIFFSLNGQARMKWSVGIFTTVKFWTHLNCDLQFIYSNGSTIGLDCSSKSS